MGAPVGRPAGIPNGDTAARRQHLNELDDAMKVLEQTCDDAGRSYYKALGLCKAIVEGRLTMLQAISFVEQLITTAERECIDCGTTKRLSEFYRSRSSKGGRMRCCKACFRIRYPEQSTKPTKQEDAA